MEPNSWNLLYFSEAKVQNLYDLGISLLRLQSQTIDETFGHSLEEIEKYLMDINVWNSFNDYIHIKVYTMFIWDVNTTTIKHFEFHYNESGEEKREREREIMNVNAFELTII